MVADEVTQIQVALTDSSLFIYGQGGNVYSAAVSARTRVVIKHP